MNYLYCFILAESLKSSIDGNLAPGGVSGMNSNPVNKIKEEEIEPLPLWQAPNGSFERFIWAVCLPLRAAAHYTMPNCRLEKWRNYYLASFFLSMLWISIFSYVMVWMITIIGT